MAKRNLPPEPPKRPELTRPIAEMRSDLEARIAEGQGFLSRRIENPPLDARLLSADHQKWTEFNAELLRHSFSTDKLADEYEQAPPVPDAYFEEPSPVDRIRRMHDVIGAEVQCLESILNRLQFFESTVAPTVAMLAVAQRSPLVVLDKLANRFHAVAQQLRARHAGRETLRINDEYDVQDLLHALLRLEFDDVRPEEYTPSYAGVSSRMDFLLKDEQIVVEVKCTRDGLGVKEVGNQLLIDIARYRSHQDCKTLFCFVYDSAGRIANPSGIEADLSHDRHGLATRVRIRPKF
jgi:hypothetical protein